MDSDDNDIDNIFEEYETENQNPEEATETNEQDNNPSNETQNTEKVPVPKRAVRNPRLKFNADRLCGVRGIPTVVNHFKDIKFKGNGHEVEDLNKLLSTLEHWCHRLYPSMKFEDCLRQIEKLGKKRPVQTCLRKIRLDMPILDNDFVQEEPEEMETELDTEVPPQDAFDKLFNEIQDSSNSQVASTPIPVKTPATQQKLGTYGSTLTEEQKKRIEYNRLLATERRKAKLLAMQSSSSIDSSQDLFTQEQSSLRNILSRQENDLIGENTTSLNILSVDMQTGKLQENFNCDTNEEELEMDELMDLVDDDLEIDSSKTSNGLCSNQSKRQLEIVDLCNESKMKNSDNSKQIKFVDLENENSDKVSPKKSFEVIDLDKEVLRSDMPLGIVDLENEDTLQLPRRNNALNNINKLPEWSETNKNINKALHGNTMKVIDLDQEISKSQSTNEVVDLENEETLCLPAGKVVAALNYTESNEKAYTTSQRSDFEVIDLDKEISKTNASNEIVYLEDEDIPTVSEKHV